MTIEEAKRIVHLVFPVYEATDLEWGEICGEMERLVNADNIENAADVLLQWASYRIDAIRDAMRMRQYAREHNIK